MSESIHSALNYASEHENRILTELKDFLSIASISTDSAYHDQVRKAADWCADRLEALGMTRVEIIPKPPTHPVVFGENLSAGPEAPTILVYGHYDVQPPDPLDLWESPPFEADVRGDWLYARGSSDMKGQVMASIAAVEAVARTNGLPLNIKFLLEGQEEIGSRQLGDFIRAHKELLTCDVSLNPDAGMLAQDTPSLTYALRGLADFELRLYGPTKDLHSGLFGGVVHNTAQALCEVVAGMHDAEGRVTLPGFYDRVRPIDETERAELMRLPRAESFYLEQSGVSQLWGEPEFQPVERVGARPSLDINGIFSGFVGEGSKTVIPAYAMAKISIRLVPDQIPTEVREQLESYLQSNVPSTIRWELTQFSGNPASISDLRAKPNQAMSRALEEVWDVRPLLNRVGGTIPVVGMIQQILGVESVLTGFGLPEDNVHSPNERLHLPTWRRGIEALIRFLYYVAD